MGVIYYEPLFGHIQFDSLDISDKLISFGDNALKKFHFLFFSYKSQKGHFSRLFFEKLVNVISYEPYIVWIQFKFHVVESIKNKMADCMATPSLKKFGFIFLPLAVWLKSIDIMSVSLKPDYLAFF